MPLKNFILYNVFPNAVVEPLISIYQKKESLNEEFEIVLVPRKTALTSTFLSEGLSSVKNQTDLRKNAGFVFNYKIDSNRESIVKTIESRSNRLIDNYYVFNGAKPYEVGKGNPPQTKEIQKGKIYNGYTKIDDSWIPYMRGKNIQRFTTMWDGEYIKYGENLAAPRNPENFFREKIFVRQTGDSIIAQLDNGNVSNNTLHIVYARDESVNNKYLLGLLNSALMSWFYQCVHPTEVGKPMAEVKKNFVENLPVVVGNADQVNAVIEIVDRILEICKTRYEQKQLFIKYLCSEYELKKITEKLEEFDGLSFKDFCTELIKQKIKLSASAQMELLPLFDKKIQEIDTFTYRIKKLQSQLDDEVFSIYGIDSAAADRIRNEMVIKL